MGLARTPSAQLPLGLSKRSPASAPVPTPVPAAAPVTTWGPPAPVGLVAALDVGTTKVCCLIARTDGEGGLQVVGIGHHLARGLRAGAVVDMDGAENSICAAVDAAEAMAGVTIHAAHVNISAGRQRSQTIGVEVSVAGDQVSEFDIGRAVDQAMVRADTEGRDVIHAVPTRYSIDGAIGIRDPRGMYGAKLGVNLHVVTSDSSPARNLAVCVERGHLEAIGPVASPYASALAVLVDDEMDLGATVIDMGGGTTTISVFFEGALALVDSIPVGGRHVTNDIARGLSTPTAQAERMKTLFGSAVAGPSDDKELIDVPPLGEAKQSGANHVPRAALTGIIRPRVEEIFEMARARLEASGYQNLGGRRVVLTGGASQLQGAAETAARVFENQVRLGRSTGVSGLADATSGPAFSTATGLLKYAANGLADRDVGGRLKNPPSTGFVDRIGQWLRENF
ncbi:MAG: cell division protein FtsA [Alphaproteobacteria bacterium]|jgi:cell division protein FtsA|nr:cell division protein FtsA [Alphaproteobacteria bacterium]MBT5860707.1 cell division protein FtsA [Alphaproteobacteria bacterium]